MKSDETNEKNQQSRADLLADFLRTFDHPAGINVLKHLHATAGTRCSSFHPGANGTDTHAAAKRDGGKTLVWYIEEMLDRARAASGGSGDEKPKTTGRKGPRRKIA